MIGMYFQDPSTRQVCKVTTPLGSYVMVENLVTNVYYVVSLEWFHKTATRLHLTKWLAEGKPDEPAEQ